MTDHNHWKAKESLTERVHRVGWTVTDAGCHEWKGFIDPTGYAKVMHGGKAHRVHRVTLGARGAPSTESLLALHHCDNRRCINPEHLYWGTHKDNTRDAIARNRLKAGRAQRVSDAGRSELIALHATGNYSYRQLGAKFGVTGSAAHRIVREALAKGQTVAC